MSNRYSGNGTELATIPTTTPYGCVSSGGGDGRDESGESAGSSASRVPPSLDIKPSDVRDVVEGGKVHRELTERGWAKHNAAVRARAGKK
ncbi:MAG: hypothetical protein HOW73_11760 [Polyangiaceae bacterium]|nr:hypothetical protein [Polyangiaceae bacterium]